jgi:2-oxoisovalerate dehydrogenase E1 component beta subunit
MARDDDVVLLGEDVGVKGGVFGASKGLLDAFGPTACSTRPVSEIVIAGAAIGAAMMGLRPVAEFQFADYMHPVRPDRQ